MISNKKEPVTIHSPVRN